MGTRNLTVVIQNNEVRVAQYGQWDGYPSGQGANIVEFILEKLDTESKLDDFQKKIASLSFISQEELMDLWVDAGADRNSDLVSLEVSDKFKQKNPHLSRDIGSSVLHIINDSSTPLQLKNSYNFAVDSLFCEWAYVIDLDNLVLEVYKGFNKQPIDDSNRFFNLMESCEDDVKYYPVALERKIHFHELVSVSNFLSIMDDTTDE